MPADLHASVQTAQDASIPPNLVIAAVLALVVLVVALALPAIARHWRHAGRVIDQMPLPPTDHVPTPREEMSSR